VRLDPHLPRLTLAQDGATPLLLAAQQGRAETVELLLSRGASVDGADAKACLR
jgi:ankyrin repeat protein